MIKSPILLTVVAFLLLATAGCGDGGAAVLKRRSNLMELGLAYHAFYASQQRGPADAAELVASMSSQASSDSAVADAITSLEEGDIVMIWAGVLGDSTENARYVLAFEARAPASGGYVVMGDGEVRLMTGKDFSQAAMLPQSTDAP